jgi:hypothetical protein
VYPGIQRDMDNGERVEREVGWLVQSKGDKWFERRRWVIVKKKSKNFTENLLTE